MAHAQALAEAVEQLDVVKEYLASRPGWPRWS